MDKFETFRYMKDYFGPRITVMFDADLSDPNAKKLNASFAFCSWHDPFDAAVGRNIARIRLQQKDKYFIEDIPYVEGLPLMYHVYAILALNPNKYTHIIEQINKVDVEFKLPILD